MLRKYVFLSVVMVMILGLFACRGTKTVLGYGRIEFLLIPAFTFIAALVITLCFYPTRGKLWRRLVKSGLIVGVVFTGLYTLYITLVNMFDVVYLERLLFHVWISGLALYGIMVLVAVITKKKD